jgi:hypothetical protein
VKVGCRGHKQDNAARQGQVPGFVIRQHVATHPFNRSTVTLNLFQGPVPRPRKGWILRETVIPAKAGTL